MVRIMCTISSSLSVKDTASFVDRHWCEWRNCRAGCYVIATTDRTADIQGIDNHQLTNIPVGTVAGVVQTNEGAQ
jgi:hypothetical protein